MSKPEPAILARHAEAERLIDLARGLLTSPSEEIVVNYLEHAVDALHIVSDVAAAPEHLAPADRFLTPPAMARAEDRG